MILSFAIVNFLSYIMLLGIHEFILKEVSVMGINDNFVIKPITENELTKASGGAQKEEIKKYNVKMPNIIIPENPIVAPKNKPC